MLFSYLVPACQVFNPYHEPHWSQGILEARALYPDASLATLYDPDLMPAELRAAHRENDRAVEAAYGLPSDSDEADIVSHLFALYAAKTR